jgi:CheY-like chemotaxis protein/two-component sensor histidine kinase
VVILHDVSERKRFERQLYRSERLALLGQLISGVAHELNNPLAAVLGFAELSRDPRLTQSELTHNLEVIDREARRTAHIVQDLLDFSRQKTSVRVPSDVHELLERCFALLAYNFRANNITVVREYGRDLPLVVLDQYQMQQVFMNLIINAAQAMLQAQTPQPRLTVTSRRDATGGLTVEIADNGPGIPQSHLTRIFEPFFSTKQDQGTGLGLPISQGIVQQHNGSLTVTSREGEGARFRVSLPLTELVLAPEPLPPQPEPVSRPEPPRVEVFEGRVLVVDDELSVLDMAKQALSQTGLDVVTATTVKEAIEQLKATTFSLVITDVRMPDGDGTKIWEFVRAQQPRLTGHLIFVTGDPQVASRICSRLGVEVPTILKPFHVEDLCAKVRERLCPPQPRSNSAAVPRA